MDGDNIHNNNNTNDLYRECLRNHAASLGSYATDGCGEFTLDVDTSLHCAACGCHRNFHRKVTNYCSGGGGMRSPEATTEMIEYGSRRGAEMVDSGERMSGGGGSGSKKRYRTKFTVEQKEKMMTFAEKLGWKLTRKELEDEVERFCKSVGISRQVFKVWMHNHKNNSSSTNNSTTTNSLNYSTGNNASSLTTH
ncbi:hypothetical protein ACFE04_009160 [Oxalis oulophora]